MSRHCTKSLRQKKPWRAIEVGTAAGVRTLQLGGTIGNDLDGQQQDHSCKCESYEYVAAIYFFDATRNTFGLTLRASTIFFKFKNRNGKSILARERSTYSFRFTRREGYPILSCVQSEVTSCSATRNRPSRCCESASTSTEIQWCKRSFFGSQLSEGLKSGWQHLRSLNQPHELARGETASDFDIS